MKWKSRVWPRRGDKKALAKRLWFPREIDDHWYWLEMVEIKYIYDRYQDYYGCTRLGWIEKSVVPFRDL